MMACLVVDRRLHVAKAEVGLSDRVKRLLAACPDQARDLKAVLAKRPASIVVSTGEGQQQLFFDQAQIECLTAKDAAVANSGTPSHG